VELSADEEAFSLRTSPYTSPPHWALWLRREKGDIAIEVPTAGRHYRTLRVGKTWWEATNATALLVHNAKADTDLYQSQRDGTFSNEASILRSITLSTPSLQVLSVNAFLQYENPGVDALLSDGRPRLSPSPSLPIETLATQLVARSGGNSRIYSAGPSELRFHDSMNPRRKAVETAGGSYLTAYLSPTFRLRFGGLSDSPTLAGTLNALGIPVVQREFSKEWPGSVLPAEAAEEVFAPLQRSLQRFGTTGHPGELSRLRSLARTLGAQLEIWVETEDGIPYLYASNTTQNLLAPLTNFQPQTPARSLEELRLHGRTLIWGAR
jgi:hypothetical protein